jgi:branched-chain amino acid transport system substrate-binding protein
MKFSTRLYFLLAVALLLPGCLGKAEPQPIVIGHISTLSGPGSAAGQHAMRGIRLALEELDRDPAKGPGRPVVVRHTDAHGELEAFASEAVRLVAINRAVALLGGHSAAEVERLEKAEVPVISPQGLHTRGMGDLVFLSGLSPVFQGQVLARFAAQDLKATTAGVIADERRDDAVTLAEAFIHSFQASGAREPSAATAPRPVLWRFGKSSRPDELAARMRESKFTFLLFAGDASDLRDFLAKWNPPAMPVLWAGDDVAASSLASMANQALYHVTAFTSDADTPLTKAFVEQYRKTFNEEPDSFAALANDDIRLLAEALRQADNHFSPANLKEKLAALKDFPGLTGTLSIDPDHQVHRPAFVVRLESGRWRTIKRDVAPP